MIAVTMGAFDRSGVDKIAVMAHQHPIWGGMICHSNVTVGTF